VGHDCVLPPLGWDELDQSPLEPAAGPAHEIRPPKDRAGEGTPTRVDVPVRDLPLDSVWIASIIVAEGSRQAGARPTVGPRISTRKGLTYESALANVAGVAADPMTPAELRAY
jgi:hypothetical protein